MARKKGKSTELMLSLYLAEATYDAGVTMNDSNACSLKGYTVEEDWPDEVLNDREEITGSEFSTSQEILTKGFTAPISIPKARPNDIIGLMALAMGGTVTSTQDGATGAYTHEVALAAIEADLPSIQAELKKGGVQYYYRGVKCSSIKLAGEAGQPVSLEAELMGSGTRATSSTSFAVQNRTCVICVWPYEPASRVDWRVLSRMKRFIQWLQEGAGSGAAIC